MAVRPGYKQTEVGVIPVEWEVRSIGDFAKVKGGKRLPSGRSLVDTPTPHPYIRVLDMRFGGIDMSDIKYVPDEVFSTIHNYRIWDSDIFISVAGTLGIVGKIPSALDGANLTENADRITGILCDRDYLLYNLMSERIQKIIESEKTVGAQPKLALKRIKSFRIALPPSNDEQRAIAEALGHVDALIGGLERLIAKKRDLKQAAMQQLLTGQTRLPGFSGEWEVKRLGEIGSFSKGRGLSKEELVDSGNVPAIPYTAIYTDFTEVITYSKIAHFINSTRNTVIINGPHLLIAGSSNMLENIGKAAAYVDNTDVAVGGDIIIYRTTTDVRFLSYLLSTQPHRKRVVFLSQGSTIRHVYRSTFERYELDLPSHREQTAISAVVSDMEAEIEALEKRLAKTRVLKQGMMQELLTGRTRLPVS